jgi:hypothetical protein
MFSTLQRGQAPAGGVFTYFFWVLLQVGFMVLPCSPPHGEDRLQSSNVFIHCTFSTVGPPLSWLSSLHFHLPQEWVRHWHRHLFSPRYSFQLALQGLVNGTSLCPFFRVSIVYLNCVMASTPSGTSPLYIFAKYPAAVTVFIYTSKKGIILMGPNSPIPCCGNILQYIWWQLHAGRGKV